MSYALNVLNSIRANASTEYASRVPIATKNNIAEIGRALDSYDNVYNEFIDTLLHKIGFTIVQTALFTNKLAKFKSGRVLTGQDVEDIFVNAFISFNFCWKNVVVIQKSFHLKKQAYKGKLL